MRSAETTEHGWKTASNLLCVRLDAVGDVLMTTPALRALRRAYPSRPVTLLTSPAGAALAALIPEVDEVIPYAAPWMKATPTRVDAGPDLAMAEQLRAHRFDGAVIFTVYSQSPLPAAMLCYLAGIPLRLAHCRENPYQLLTDWAREREPEHGIRHEVRRQLDLVAGIGARTADERLSLRIPRDTRERMARRVAELGVDRTRPWVVIHPGATALSRCYPPDGYARAARLLAREHGCQVVFTGTAEERALVENIQDAMDAPSHSLAGQLDLAELAALIALAPVLVVNNTGPAHIAAAMGTPVVDLYALTNPQHTPWGVEARVLFHDVPCKYCHKSICPEGHHDCLRLVLPETVAAAAMELVAAAPRATLRELTAVSTATLQ